MYPGKITSRVIIQARFFTRAGHNFQCPLKSQLSVDPLIIGTILVFHIQNVNLTEERLFFYLKIASAL
jgi:hypothetical protein